MTKILFKVPFGTYSSYSLECPEGSSLARQEFQDECDINLIVPRSQELGLLEHTSAAQAAYRDLLGAVDYQTAANAFIDAGEAFMALPSDIRARFDNDPAKLLNFVDDSSNLDEAYKLGILREDFVPAKQDISTSSDESQKSAGGST